MHVASQVFQLEPSFYFKQLCAEANTRNKFLCTVKLLDCEIVAALGQNKADSKRNAAKLALSKVSPNLYEDLFEGEQPPEDELCKEGA